MRDKAFSNSVFDWKLFGESEDKLVSITHDTYLMLHILDYRRRKILSFSRHKMEDREKFSSLAVSDKNNYILVELFSYNSKMVVFKVEGNLLVKKAVLNDTVSLDLNSAFGFCGYFGSHLL